MYLHDFEDFVAENKVISNSDEGEKGHKFEKLVLGYSGRDVASRLSSKFRDSYGNKITDIESLIRITKDIQNLLCNCNPTSPSTEILKILYYGILERIRRK